jgi:hypothetical protein
MRVQRERSLVEARLVLHSCGGAGRRRKSEAFSEAFQGWKELLKNVGQISIGADDQLRRSEIFIAGSYGAVFQLQHSISARGRQIA